MSNKEYIRAVLNENIKVHSNLLLQDILLQKVDDAAQSINVALQNGNKLMICGNGGSSADAQHMAAELVGRFEVDRQSLPAIALNTDNSALTSIGNDFGFEFIFSRQVLGLGNSGDILIGISTSGNSNNIVTAFQAAKVKEIVTIGLLGRDGGKIKALSDIAIIVDEDVTARIQEAHITIIHILCGVIEQSYAEGKSNEK